MFMRYLRRTLNYLETIALSNLTHVMIMTNLVAIGVETPMKASRCSVKKEFSELIYINP